MNHLIIARQSRLFKPSRVLDGFHTNPSRSAPHGHQPFHRRLYSAKTVAAQRYLLNIYNSYFGFKIFYDESVIMHLTSGGGLCYYARV
jgi:hypothetical protein